MIANQRNDDSEFEMYTSADGQLALTVAHTAEGEIVVGFHGFDWQTHGELLAETSGLDVESAVKGFVNKILNDEAIIAVLYVDGDIRDVWITDYPGNDITHCREGETLTLRHWSGKPYRLPE